MINIEKKIKRHNFIFNIAFGIIIASFLAFIIISVIFAIHPEWIGSFFGKIFKSFIESTK